MKLSLRPRRNDSLTSVFDRFFDHPFVDRLPEVFQAGLTPAVNISENEKTYKVHVELPGLKEEDIDLQVLGNQLILSAERKFEEEKKGDEFHKIEHQYGSFSRTIPLPNGLKTDAVEAAYKRGILTMTFPKVEPTPATKIKIEPEH